MSEYIQSNVSSFNSSSFKGYNVVASYVLSGEMREYNKRNGLVKRLKVANEVMSDGWGAWEVYSRWSTVDTTDQNVCGGVMNKLSLGLNWWLLSSIQANVNYRYSTLDRFGEQGYNHGLVTRLAFMLE